MKRFRKAENIFPVADDDVARSFTRAVARSSAGGSLMDMLARHYVDKLMPVDFVGCGTLRWATMCSGSEITHYAAEFLENFIRETGRDITLVQVFASESNHHKRDWIKSVVKKSLCIFNDCSHCHRSHAACSQHDRLCSIVGCDVLVMGFSCKDLSRQNTSRSNNQRVPAEETSRGASATTFNACLGYVDVHHPAILIIENVDALADDDGDGGNLDILFSEFGNRGYEVQPIMVNATEWGLSHRRRRLWFFIVFTSSPLLRLSFRSGGVQATLSKFVAIFERTKAAPLDVYKVLLPNDHPLVEAHLAFLITHHADSRDLKESGWTEAHMTEYSAAGARWGQPRCSDGDSSSAWYPFLTDRERDILALKSWLCPEKTLLDLSQSISRVPMSSFKDVDGQQVEMAPCLLPGMKLWSTRLHRLVTGFEAIKLQGFPVDLSPAPSLSTDSLMKDLAGNSFSGTVVLAFIASFIFAIDWSCDPEHSEPCTSSADVEAALSWLPKLKRQKPQ